MKKTFFVLAVLCLGALAFGQKHDHNDFSGMERTVDAFGNDVWIAVDPPLPQGAFEETEEELLPQEELTEAGTVNVYAAGDEEYRSYHGSGWTNTVYTIIETADNRYYQTYGINWVIQGYYNWTSSGSSASAILYDLQNDFSWVSRGLVMGFSRDSKFNAGGIAFVYNSNPGTGYSVCKDQGTNSTIYALRHEAGHNYGCGHDPTGPSPVCMMNYQYSYSVDYFDSAHSSTVSSHGNWFR